MNLIYVASPYAGDIERNTEFAKKACWFVMNEGHAFFAPHLLYPQVLNEHDSDDRRLGLGMGKEALAHCDELWVFGDTISCGMQNEIDAARKLGIPVKYVAAQEMIEKERPFAERHSFCSIRM
jgi:hypothetical protein